MFELTKWFMKECGLLAYLHMFNDELWHENSIIGLGTSLIVMHPAPCLLKCDLMISRVHSIGRSEPYLVMLTIMQLADR